MTKLVIVESPAKCGKIAGFLGADYKVVATFGHIRALDEDLDAVGLDRDFDPRYRFLTKEKAKAINAIKDAAKGCTQIFLAADDDREGEAIAYSACLLLKMNPATTARAVFREITHDAVCGAIAKPRLLDMSKVFAQQSRAVLDMMVGFTISPLLWKHVGSGLSAGRCQTPALRLVWEREEEIRNFRAESSWGIKGTWFGGSSSPFDASLTDDLEDEESALNYLENHSDNQAAVVCAADTRPWTESAPDALITSTLQQQSSSLFHIGPKNTMSSAQRLYEQGHITYMRTDSTTMSEEAVDAAKVQVEALYGRDYIGLVAPVEENVTVKVKVKAGRPKKDATSKAQEAPKAQEAHEAIRPTHFEHRTLPADEDWSAIDRKIYGLIWLRAIQSIMASAKGEKRIVKFVAEGDEEAGFEWASDWKRTTFEGWKKADTKATEQTDGDATKDAAADAWTAATALVPGSKLKWATLEAFPKTTKSHPRYTEATLVRELEKRGIGRPSTFAMLIGTIQEKNYVEKKHIEGAEVIQKRYMLNKPNVWNTEGPQSEEKKVRLGAEKDKLVPTGLGASVVEFALKHFPDLFNYPFTAAMETRLDKIADGSEEWKLVLRDTWNSYKERYSALKTAKTSAEDSDHRRELGDGLTAIKTRKGPLLMRESPDGNKDETKFYGWPSGVAFGALQLAEALTFINGKDRVLGSYEGEDIRMKDGPYGKYIQYKDVKLPYSDGETLDAMIERISAKLTSVSDAKQVGQYEIRNGPYGLYMFKHAAAKKQFVSVPAGVNIMSLTEAAATALFQAGLAAKARSQKFKSIRTPVDGENGSKKYGKGKKKSD